MFTIGQSDKVIDAEIDPNRRPNGSRSSRPRQQERKAHIPTTCDPTNGRGPDYRISGKSAMPFHLDLPDALQDQAAILKVPPRVPGQTVVPAARPESRISWLCACSDPAIKTAECPIQATKGVPHCSAAHPMWTHASSPYVCQIATLCDITNRTPLQPP
jgi:hypothetical protein